MRAGYEQLAMGIEPIRNKGINYFEWITMYDNETRETNIQAACNCRLPLLPANILISSLLVRMRRM